MTRVHIKAECRLGAEEQIMKEVRHSIVQKVRDRGRERDIIQMHGRRRPSEGAPSAPQSHSLHIKKVSDFFAKEYVYIMVVITINERVLLQ
jgi:hypothetical protein